MLMDQVISTPLVGKRAAVVVRAPVRLASEAVRKHSNVSEAKEHPANWTK